MSTESHARVTAKGRPLRILMVLESELESGGGAESQLRTLAKRLEELGHSVTIATPLYPGEVAEGSLGKVPVRRFEFPEKRGLGTLVLNARLAAFLFQNRDKYDAFHVHIGHALGATTCVVGSMLRKPVVVKISGWWELEKGLLARRPGVFSRVARACLQRASATQAISSRIAGELERAGFQRGRIVQLPNGVDLSRFARLQAPREEGRPFTAVFVGRFVPEKEVSVLLAAWAKAFAGKTDVRLKLVGEGPLEPELRAQAEKLGIAQTVEFVGFLKKVEQALAGSHVGVLPSRIEGLSNVLLEMLSCGLPPIASRVSGSEDFIVTGKNGWLFDVGDVDALAKHFTSAYELPAAELAEMGNKARAEVEERAALDVVIGRLLELYSSRANGRGPTSSWGENERPASASGENRSH